jgi:hypothetical protein
MVRISQAVGLSLSLSRRQRAPLVKRNTPLRPVPCGSQEKDVALSMTSPTFSKSGNREVSQREEGGRGC